MEFQGYKRLVATIKETDLSSASRKQLLAAAYTAVAADTPVEAGAVYASANETGRRVVVHNAKDNTFGLVNVDTGRLSLRFRRATELADKIKAERYFYVGEDLDEAEEIA